jgi:hypothetical protein
MTDNVLRHSNIRVMSRCQLLRLPSKEGPGQVPLHQVRLHKIVTVLPVIRLHPFTQIDSKNSGLRGNNNQNLAMRNIPPWLITHQGAEGTSRIMVNMGLQDTMKVPPLFLLSMVVVLIVKVTPLLTESSRTLQHRTLQHRTLRHRQLRTIIMKIIRRHLAVTGKVVHIANRALISLLDGTTADLQNHMVQNIPTRGTTKHLLRIVHHLLHTIQLHTHMYNSHASRRRQFSERSFLGSIILK